MNEPQAEPTLTYQGQFITPSQAETTRSALMSDPEFTKAVLAGDASKRAQLGDLLLLARGYQPGAGSNPQGVADVEVQADQRAILEQERVIDTWAHHIRMTPELKVQMQRGLATQEQHDFAVAEVARMKLDAGFRTRLLAGDMDARDRWGKMNLVAAARVAPADYKW